MHCPAQTTDLRDFLSESPENFMQPSRSTMVTRAALSLRGGDMIGEVRSKLLMFDVRFAIFICYIYILHNQPHRRQPGVRGHRYESGGALPRAERGSTQLDGGRPRN